MRERDALGLFAEWRERFAELFAGHEGTVVVGDNGAGRVKRALPVRVGVGA